MANDGFTLFVAHATLSTEHVKTNRKQPIELK